MGVGRVSSVIILMLASVVPSFSQCGTALGDETSYGNNQWFGYVYDGTNVFAGTYMGRITETAIFDESFCGDNCNFTAATGCAVNTESFSIRFKMLLTIATCGYYNFTIGGDDGVRLSVNGGITYLIDGWGDHPYATYSGGTYMPAGNHELILEFYENAGQNRVSFTYASATGPNVGGGYVAGSQTICDNPIDPAAFTNYQSASNCAGSAVTYRWQSSTDNVTFANITGATSATYNLPSGQPAATRYYRRRATIGGTNYYSNTLTVSGELSQGDEVSGGANSWIGYVYDGVNTFATTSYRGFITETAAFDESFCGDNCNIALSGCATVTETFSVRFRMTFTVATAANYTFVVGGDDGYRFSINNGSSYLVSNYVDHGYVTSTSAATQLNPGTYDFVLDYFENSGGNRVSFAYTTTPLPVTWSYYNGYHEKGTNVVDWKTSTEINNSGFVVERSSDGTHFDSLGFVAGHGDALVENAYSFADFYPLSGWNYYRLKQIDYDGKFEYSRLIPINVDGNLTFGIFPNPATKEIFISYRPTEQSVDVRMRNITTNKAYSLTADPKHPTRFPLTDVVPGIYVIMFRNGTEMHTDKIVVY